MSTAQAATIVWVGPEEGNDNDLVWVDLLEAQGHTVITEGNWQEIGDAEITTMNNADVVIFGTNAGQSGEFDDSPEEIDAWNSIETPMINTMGLLLRSSHWNWMDSTETQYNFAASVIEADDPGHPVLAGISLNASNQATIYTSTDNGLYTTTGLDLGNGTLIAHIPGEVIPVIAFWEAGVETYDGSGVIPPAPRLFFSIAYYSQYNINADGEIAFLNAVDFLLGNKGQAGGANPANGADNLWPRDITLSWTAGEFADKHDVYFSSDFNDVNDGVALISGAQDGTSYAVGDLELETTYYWRIDEVNAPSSPGTIAGKVWSFTTEPIGYPLPSENIVGATASSRYEGSDPNKTYDGSGIDVNDMHSIEGADMWVSDESGRGESWIKYEFDGVYRLHQMKVWNYNETSLANFGFKDVTVEYSLDDLEWYALTDVPQFAKADGKVVCAADTTVDFGGVEAKYVKLTALKNWGSFIYQQYGLSEVRFLCVPLQSRYPSPDDEDTGVAVDVTLGWRAGRDAESHDVSYSTDEAAVAGGTATVQNVSEMSYGPVSLNLGTMYYWKVDEVDSNNVRAGSVWSFSTQEYIVVEDFEFYTDDEPNRVWDFWADGWDDSSNGSTMGYPDPVFEDGEHFVETDTVYSGSQSGPLLYNNTFAADGVTPVDYSEVTLDLGSAQNWTSNGADEVIMSFHGNAVEFYESDDGSIAMSAEGVDIYDVTDEFRYAYKTLNGDGSITVRVDSIQNTNVWSKAGIMIRNSLEPNDVHVTAVLAASGTAELEYRSEIGGSTSTQDVTGLGNPCWLRITRSGDDFTLERSTDGVEWLSFETDANNASTETVEMGNTVYIGLVVTSHEADIAAAATFYNPTTTGNVSGADWTVEAIGDTEQLSVNTIDKLYLALVDSGGHRHDVYAPVATAVGWGDWYEWKIPQSEYSSNGVNMASIKKIIVGVGDAADPMHGQGTIFIDDIGYGHTLIEQ
jgi:regulation of enolase protein 1 (concanavalin A-like superfamily)